MNPWDTCVATALMGVEKQSPTLDFTHPALNTYVLSDLPPTEQLLTIAGLLVTYQKTGYQPNSGKLTTLPAPAETLQICSGVAAQHCRAVLVKKTTVQGRQLLPELLHLLQRTQQTVPPILLPALLDWGRFEDHLQPLILPILGQRGQWLAQQNPHWAYANQGVNTLPNLADLQHRWETSNGLERQIALRLWRQHQPNAARQALGQCWTQEKANDRQTWIRILEVGLSQADEEFLEQALSDRAVGVRQQAAQLLGRMPSRYRRRIGQIAVQWLQIEGSEQGCHAQVQLPKAAQPEWLAEGLSDKVPKDHPIATNVPSWLLLQVLGATDLYRWGADLDVTPELLIAAILNLRHHNALILSGWTTAAVQQGRVDWITALLERAGHLLPEVFVLDLLQALPTIEEQEKYLLRFWRLERSLPEAIRMALPILKSWPGPWGLELSQGILYKISSYLTQNLHRRVWQEGDDEFQQLLQIAGYHLDHSLLPTLLTLPDQIGDQPHQHRQALKQCLEMVTFCRSMRVAFASQKKD